MRILATGLLLLSLAASLLAGCGDDGDPDAPAALAFPDVIAAEATRDAAGTWTFAVTLSSPYDSPTRYADAWRVLDEDGTEIAVRVLTHDHASEQPFTRSLPGIEIDEAVKEVTVQGRDLVNGWGGAEVHVTLEAGGEGDS